MIKDFVVKMSSDWTQATSVWNRNSADEATTDIFDDVMERDEGQPYVSYAHKQKKRVTFCDSVDLCTLGGILIL